MTDAEDPKVEAVAEVTAATAAHEAAKAEEKTKREALHAAIVKAIKAGVGPSELERVTSYDRQHIHRIRKAADVPATRKRTVQRIPKEE